MDLRRCLHTRRESRMATAFVKGMWMSGFLLLPSTDTYLFLCHLWVTSVPKSSLIGPWTSARASRVPKTSPVATTKIAVSVVVRFLMLCSRDSSGAFSSVAFALTHRVNFQIPAHATAGVTAPARAVTRASSLTATGAGVATVETVVMTIAVVVCFFLWRVCRALIGPLWFFFFFLHHLAS